MKKPITITGSIGIDMAHRVPDHASKCHNIHGHRYTVHTSAAGPLMTSGAEKGMVMDFGFLKEAMMDIVDKNFDHALCLYIGDPILNAYLGPMPKGGKKLMEQIVLRDGYHVLQRDNDPLGAGKLVVVDRVPTAECLAVIWAQALYRHIYTRYEGQVRVQTVKVWETPNFSAEFDMEAHTELQKELLNLK